MAEVWRLVLAVAALAMGLTAGAVMALMMVRLIPGAWRDSLTAPLTRLTRSFAPATLLAVPVLVGARWIYPWAHGHGRGGESLPGFWLRTALWFAGLGMFAYRARRGFSKLEAVIGLLILVPSGTVISVDWLMSLDTGFNASGFGLYVLSQWIGLALCLAIWRAGPSDDHGRMVMGGVMTALAAVWLYMAFMQFFVIWSGDLRPGVAWYQARSGPWSMLIWTAAALRAAGGVLGVTGLVRARPAWLKRLAAAGALAAVPEMLWLTLPLGTAR